MAAPALAASTEVSKVSKDTIGRAVTALVKWKTTKSETQKAQLLDSDEFVYLVITLHKIPPKGRTNAYRIPLPNPLYSDHSEICLVIDDRNLESKSAKQKVLDEKIPVAKVLKLSKLRSDYKAFEAKRKLCDSYDLFLADKRIVHLLPKAIGKHFFKKKKVPIPIELGRKNWKEQIERVCGSALLFIHTGTCCVVKVARGSMENDEIVENVAAAVDGVVEFIPKKWKNIRSLHLKFAESVPLPLYQAVPEMKLKFGGGFGGMEAVDEGLIESDKVESTEKKGKNKVGKKKGRIHEVRYMDNVGFGDLIGEDESGSDDDDGGVIENEEKEGDELGSAEIASKKRKNVGGAKEGKKMAKVKKVEKDLKQKKEKGSEKKSKKSLSKGKNDDDGDMGSAEIAVEKVKKGEKGLKQKKEKGSEKKPKKRSSKGDDDNDDGDMGSAEVAVEKGKKGVKNVSKGKKSEKDLKKMKEEVLGKSAVSKKTKKSKVAL